jgi:hypothetical protein
MGTSSEADSWLRPAIQETHCKDSEKGRLACGTGCERVDWSTQRSRPCHKAIVTQAAEEGERVPVRPHDSGSQANETIDGLDAAAEALRHAVEDTASGAAPDDVEKRRCSIEPV